MLRPIQEKNRIIDFRRNLEVAAGLVKPTADANEVTEKYKFVETKLVDLATGDYVTDMDPESYDQDQAAKDPKQHVKIKNDIAKIHYRAKIAKVYLIKDESGQISKFLLPIKGKGLWSTMYGFIALKPDSKTVDGFGFYEQGETPGLGGEVDNPRWKAKWKGKTLLDSSFKPNLQIVKGGVREGTADAVHQIDALSGATLTSRGVENLVNYWMGEDGFGNFLAKVRAGGML
jgi:Na+-transporting NADH:ubiquinone oxidoreductase subunit C